MHVRVSFKKDDYWVPCPDCGKTVGADSFWVKQYGYNRFTREMYTCFARTCENCFRRSLLGKSRKLFYCQGCGSLKHFDDAVRYGLHHGTVYICQDCHDRAIDEYFTSPDGSYSDPVRYDHVCSVCGRAFMKCDTNYKSRACDDPEPEEPCVCDVCSGLLQLGEDKFIDFLGIDLDTLQSLQTLYELREAGRLAGMED